jgi:4-hydroxybenzoate polyprenyltransferase
VDRDDDLRIGMKTSAITLGRFDVPAIMCFYALHLLIWWALLLPFDLGWPFTMSLWTAAAQAVWHFVLIRKREREPCFLAFRTNHWLGATMFVGIALGFALR